MAKWRSITWKSKWHNGDQNGKMAKQRSKWQNGKMSKYMEINQIPKTNSHWQNGDMFSTEKQHFLV